ncbi:MAG: DUF3786 domain-containing protein [Clostridiales bacterium]|nr:DUF3786 domain-containing protein [Clostridiales bacterium]
MELEFVKYDQQEMIRKFSLKHDKDFLFIRFAGREYRIDRKSGRVEWYSGKEKEYIHAGYNESMTIFDVLAWSKPNCHLDGHYAAMQNLRGITRSASAVGNIFAGQAGSFAGRCEELREACRKLGGMPGENGDVSSIIPLFDFLPVILQFWDADEEFDAVLKFMWDYNTTDFMHFETIAFATGHLINRLKEIMKESSLSGEAVYMLNQFPKHPTEQ